MLVKDVDNVIHTPQTFSLMIEKKAAADDSSYMDAIIGYCEIIGVDVTEVAKLIQPQLKQKMRIQLEESNILKRVSTTGSLYGEQVG